jgi:uncharacterized membrane protein
MFAHLAEKAAVTSLKVLGGRALRSGAQAARAAVGRAAATGRNALQTSFKERPPVQASVDVAVPIVVAWDEWMTFEFLTEGVHRIEDVERDGGHLRGRIGGAVSTEWEAEIVDEREQQSFAWRSQEGSDCAGLVTFHQLSDRLTRIELDLDVVATNPAQMVSLASHLADRRAQTELRRFKAAVEFINPDVYEAELRRNGTGPTSDQDQAEEQD